MGPPGSMRPLDAPRLLNVPHRRGAIWPFGFLLYEPQRLIFVIVAVVITGGALCYWLARYLTRPLASLRSAAGQLAEGDLSVRVGDSLDGRKDEIGDLGRDFDRMAERLHAMITSERQLLRDISHELRSPLARLNIALGIARQQFMLRTAPGSASPEGAALDRIESESLRLNDLIEQLLTLVRLEGGIEQMQRSQVDLAEVVDQVARDAEFEAGASGVRVEAAVDLPSCLVDGDRELLRRAVENVVRNAVYYSSPQNAVEIRLNRGHRGESAVAEIVVRDHGPGLPEEALTEIFRPFYRAQSARDRNTGGVGLGLAITDRAVRAHGGTITAANADGGGLLVTITIPLSEI